MYRVKQKTEHHLREKKTPLVQWGKPGGSGQTWAFMKGVKIPDWSKINSLSRGLTFTLAKARRLALTWRKAPLMVLTFRPFEVYWAHCSLWEILGFSIRLTCRKCVMGYPCLYRYGWQLLSACSKLLMLNWEFGKSVFIRRLSDAHFGTI